MNNFVVYIISYVSGIYIFIWSWFEVFVEYPFWDGYRYYYTYITIEIYEYYWLSDKIISL